MFPNYREFHLSHFFFKNQSDANSGGEGDGNNSQSNNQNNSNVETFESWLEAQPDEIKNKAKPLFTAHVEKLQSTVKATRKERDDLSVELRDAAKKLEKESAERKALEDSADKLDAANRRADFYEDAPSHNCRNSKAAYIIAEKENLFLKNGLPDWKKIEETAPEFFGEVKKKLPGKGGAGSGTGEEPASGLTMNDWIRAQAKR